jgi:hypothetical protein
MPKPLRELRERLLKAGVAPRHVRRYLRELTEHLADLTAEEIAAGHAGADAENTALARLGGIDELANAMIQQRQFQSWASRAPWLTFGAGSLAALTAAYFIACSLLLCGWKLFLPTAQTPFGHELSAMHAFAKLYFAADKSWYYGAPIVVGLGIAVIAVRQRLNSVWLVIGLALDTYMGATARIYANRVTLHNKFTVSMSFFSLPDSSAAASRELLYAIAIFSLSILPYVAWRFRNAYPLSRNS